MAIKNYTTKVDVYTSIGEIQGALARHGATKIMIDYDNGKPQAIAFGIDTPVGPRGFRLPAAVDGTLRVFAAQKIKADREQAEMTAWRNVRDWVLAQIALIELRSLFIPNGGTEYLLDLLSRMSDENTVSTNDNGVTQAVTARQGIALNAVVNVRPRIKLQPFRTFLEVAQPESEFLLRVDSEKGIAFFEADGGIWRLEAKRNIAEYFERGLKDLIEQGKVVIMQ